MFSRYSALIVLLILKHSMVLAAETIPFTRRGIGLGKEAERDYAAALESDVQDPSLKENDEGSVPSENLVEDSAVQAKEEKTSDSNNEDFGEFEEEFAKEMERDSERKVFDPLSGYNRLMFTMNDKLYSWLLKPMAQGYNYVVPQPVRASIDRAFQNLLFPMRFSSSLLQFKMKKTATELGRFLVNSTAGLGGLFDPAGKYLKWHSSKEDLGQVLGFYKVGDGFPVVLPLLGQTNLRDGIAAVPASWFNPVFLVADFKTLLAVRSSERFNFISLHLGEYESLKKDALDPYLFFRDAYKQRRDREIKE